MSHYSVYGNDSDGYSFSAIIRSKRVAERVYHNLRETMPQRDGYGLTMDGPHHGDVDQDVVAVSGPSETMSAVCALLLKQHLAAVQEEDKR